MNTIYREELAADGTTAGVELEENLYGEKPFNPDKIFIHTKDVPLDTLIRRIRKGAINLAPAFQRKAVWGLEQKSRLIESLMLKIPIPMFYVSGDRQETWDVVDGLQRLTTICEFLWGTSEYSEICKYKELDYSNGFKLKGLEFWGELYDGKRLTDLPDTIQTRILESSFVFTIIEAGTPEAVKRNIFKRINTGGMPLTAQEIRHALYQGAATALLEKLSKNENFIKAVSKSVDDSRMAGREMILRMLAFMLVDYHKYPSSGDMDSFICEVMFAINESHKNDDSLQDAENKNVTVSDLVELFSRSMQRAYLLFGAFAFRRTVIGKARTPVNKALFEVWGCILARLSDDCFRKLLSNKEKFLGLYQHYIQDKEVELAISRYSWKKKSVDLRFNMANKIIDEFLS